MASTRQLSLNKRQVIRQSQSCLSKLCCCFSSCFQVKNTKISQSQCNIKIGIDEQSQKFRKIVEDKDGNKVKGRGRQRDVGNENKKEISKQQQKAYKNQQILRKQDLEHTSNSFSTLDKTPIQYDNDVQDYFFNIPSHQNLIYQYISIRNYPQNQVLLFGSTSKVFFKITSKPLCISPQLSQKIKQSLRKLKNSPLVYPNKIIEKCWKKRYTLFEKFDLGIKFDEQSYISTPPETLTSYLSTRLKFNKIIHIYPDIGAYDLKLSNTCESIIVTNIKYKTIDCLQNNLSLFRVDNVTIIPTNIVNINTIDNQNIDAILITPPWGMDYTTQQQYNLQKMQLDSILLKSISLSSSLILVLPSNINLHQLASILGRSLQQSFQNNINIDSCIFEVEKIYFLNRLRFIIVYYGKKVCRDGGGVDQMESICKIMGSSLGEMGRIGKIVKEEYGMYYLLRLVLRKELAKGEGNQFEKLVQIIRRQQIINQNKLNLILNINNSNTSSNNSHYPQIQRITYKTNHNSLVEQQQEKDSKFTKKTITESYASFYQPGSNMSVNSRNTINVRITSKATDRMESKLSSWGGGENK